MEVKRSDNSKEIVAVSGLSAPINSQHNLRHSQMSIFQTCLVLCTSKGMDYGFSYSSMVLKQCNNIMLLSNKINKSKARYRLKLLKR